MPFQSEAQRRYLWATNPELARRWAEEEKSGKYKRSRRKRSKRRKK